MDDIDKAVEHQKELAERRRLWEEQRLAESEERVRQEKRARMEAWLTNRRQAWLDHTGSLAPADMVEGWKAEYVAERAAEAELERELRLAQAADDAVV